MTMLEETFGIQEFKIFSYLECYIGEKKQALYYRSRNSAVATFKLKGLERTDIDRISATVRNIQNNNPYQGWSEGISVVPASIISKIIQEDIK